jgi:hypothetical protein
MTEDEVVKMLEPWRVRHRRPAWDPVVDEGDGPRDAPKFGGVPWTGPGAPWPDCKACDAPLPLLVQLDLARLPAELAGRCGSGLLQLFYCTRDDCGGASWQPFDDEVSCVRVVQPAGRGFDPSEEQREALLPARRIVGWEAFLDEPEPGEHEALGLSYDFDFAAWTVTIDCPEVGLAGEVVADQSVPEAVGDCKGGDKLAGWPNWVQGVEYPACPRCGKRMERQLPLHVRRRRPRPHHPVPGSQGRRRLRLGMLLKVPSYDELGSCPRIGVLLFTNPTRKRGPSSAKPGGRPSLARQVRLLVHRSRDLSHELCD